MLAAVVQQRGAPGHIRSDNGPEFIARAIRSWVAEAGMETLYIEPGAPGEVYPGLAGNLWPTTEGTVRSMKMFYKARSIDDVNNPKDFSVELQYEYTVNGTAYTRTAYNTNP